MSRWPATGWASWAGWYSGRPFRTSGAWARELLRTKRGPLRPSAGLSQGPGHKGIGNGEAVFVPFMRHRPEARRQRVRDLPQPRLLVAAGDPEDRGGREPRRDRRRQTQRHEQPRDPLGERLRRQPGARGDARLGHHADGDRLAVRQVVSPEGFEGVADGVAEIEDLAAAVLAGVGGD